MKLNKERPQQGEVVELWEVLSWQVEEVLQRKKAQCGQRTEKIQKMKNIDEPECQMQH